MYINLMLKNLDVVDENGVVLQHHEASGHAYVMPGKHCKENTPVHRNRFFSIIGLPEKSDDVLYIVSSDVRNAAPERDDLVTPAFPVVKNGVVTGYLSLLHEH